MPSLLRCVPAIRLLLLSGFGILLPVHPAVAQEPAAIRLEISLVDGRNGRPVTGAIVRLGGERARISDDRGMAGWEDLPSGSYILRVDHPAYERLTQQIEHVEASTPILVALTPRLFVLDELEVVGRRPLGSLRERFESRRRMGRGDFIPSEVFEERSHETLSQVIARHSRLQRRCNHSVCRLISRRRTAGFAGDNCRIQYYLDGIHFPMPPDELFDLDMFLTTSAVERAEIYLGPSQIPAEYNRFDGACGVVLIWTRGGA